MPKFKRYPISDEIILRGNWWPVGSPDKKYYGELVYKESKGILNIRGIYPTPDTPNFSGVIHGIVETEEQITLFDCICDQYGIGSAVIQYQQALIGEHVPDRNQLVVKELILEPSSFLPWVAPNEINSELIGQGAHIHLDKINPIVFLVNEKLVGKISTDFYAFNTADNGYRVERFGYIHFIFEQLQKIGDIEYLILRANWFLSLFLGCAIESVTIKFKLYNSEVHFLPKQIKYSRETASVNHRVPFEIISSHFGKILNNWFEFYKKNEDSCNLFFANIYSGGYLAIENEFLNLAQAAEVFHSVNFENKDGSPSQKKEILDLIKKTINSIKEGNTLVSKVMPMLGSIDKLGYYVRIKSLSEQLPNELKELFIKDSSKFATAVKNLRNHLTHYSGKNNFSLDEKVKMVHLLKMLLVFHFLKKCELEKTVIVETLAQRFSYLNYGRFAEVRF